MNFRIQNSISFIMSGILMLLLSCHRPSEIRLIVRGDDMGNSHDVNLAIIKAYQEGIVTSASILPGSAFFEEAVELCKSNPGLAAGVHLTLTNTASRPILPAEEVPSLVNSEGYLFETRQEFEENNPLEAEIESEFRAQIAKVRATGLKICYLDIHRDFPQVAKDIIMKLCKEEHLIYGDDPAIYGYTRKTMINEKWPFVKLPDGNIRYTEAPPLTEDEIEDFYDHLENLTPGGWALYTHPQLNDPQGEGTIELLCAERTKQILSNKHIELVSYCDIWEEGYNLSGNPENADHNFSEAPFPRIAMLWATVRGESGIEGMARHDLIMSGQGALGLKPNREPVGLSDGFTDASMEVARARVREIRNINPDAAIIADMQFYEYPDEWLPDNHDWWLRKNGERQQFWPGTHRMDWNNRDYRKKVIDQTKALMGTGVDGVFYDNLRNEPEPWIAFLSELRQVIGDDFLILVNAGYDVGTYNFAYPYVNGIMYESGWSHGRTEWDECIRQMQHSQSLLRKPRISLIERFEEIHDRAGWPGDLNWGQKPADDPAARRWSLCFALTVGDYYFLFSDNTSHRHDWYPEYDIKIGLPVEEGKRIDSHVWSRTYEKATVIVNLPGAERDYAFESSKSLQDAFTGETGTRFMIYAGDGRILLSTE